ncbi:hypothetical protein SMD44_08430 [Streptomyces alboflavus]|uniref:Uncharacterized protein n=1 Tax=Streptomyces alboflavus TaxID=67267 RepID=A0A1Z1WR66_9ACTN|nr:hypothetical protein SMD44_08430 [Streptomyces alboflavus]
MRRSLRLSLRALLSSPSRVNRPGTLTISSSVMPVSRLRMSRFALMRSAASLLSAWNFDEERTLSMVSLGAGTSGELGTENIFLAPCPSRLALASSSTPMAGSATPMRQPRGVSAGRNWTNSSTWPTVSQDVSSSSGACTPCDFRNVRIALAGLEPESLR